MASHTYRISKDYLLRLCAYLSHFRHTYRVQKAAAVPPSTVQPAYRCHTLACAHALAASAAEIRANFRVSFPCALCLQDAVCILMRRVLSLVRTFWGGGLVVVGA